MSDFLIDEPADTLLASLRDVVATMGWIEKETEEIPHQASKTVVIMWWNKVGKRLFEEATAEDDWEKVGYMTLMAEMEQVFPGVEAILQEY